MARKLSQEVLEKLTAAQYVNSPAPVFSYDEVKANASFFSMQMVSRGIEVEFELPFTNEFGRPCLLKAFGIIDRSSKAERENALIYVEKWEIQETYRPTYESVSVLDGGEIKVRNAFAESITANKIEFPVFDNEASLPLTRDEAGNLSVKITANANDFERDMSTVKGGKSEKAEKKKPEEKKLKREIIL